MPDYNTQFSTEIVHLTQVEKIWIKENVDGYAVEDDSNLFDHELDENGGNLWLYADEYGSPGAVADFLQDFFKKFRPQETKVFGWAETCSRPVLDAFGGGYVRVTAEGQFWSRIIASSEDLADAAMKLVAAGG